MNFIFAMSMRSNQVLKLEARTRQTERRT